jgi:P27 family predicted phage terminase small subunit
VTNPLHPFIAQNNQTTVTSVTEWEDWFSRGAEHANSMKKQKPKGPPPPPAQASLTVEMPNWLTDWKARAEFKRVVAILGQNVGALDQSLLADYAATYAHCQDLEDAWRKMGTVLMSAKGGAYPNPVYSQWQGMCGHLANLRRDLFFTPKSRGEKKKSQSKAQTLLDRINEA